MQKIKQKMYCRKKTMQKQNKASRNQAMQKQNKASRNQAMQKQNNVEVLYVYKNTNITNKVEIWS